VGPVNLGDVMDEIAARIAQAPSLAGRTSAQPTDTIVAPAAAVPYPEHIDFDQTYGRGVDKMTGEIDVFVGRPLERQTRDLMTRYADSTGPESIKALVDGDDYASCDSVSIDDVDFDVYTVGDIDYLTAIFTYTVYGPGEP
jgi:hypothetical protein